LGRNGLKAEIRKGIYKAAETIAGAAEVAIACHTSPDGDALGSALALGHACRAAGKLTVVSFGSPFAVADQYRFLGLDPLVPPAEFPAAPQVMVAVDVASFDRLGDLARSADRAGTLVLLDHHATNGGFGHIAVVDPGAAASAKLVYLLIKDLGWPVGEQVATALLTAIVADTGRFQYASTDGEVLRIAAELVDAGARPDEIGRQLFESLPFGYLAVSASVLGRAHLERDLGLVWSVLYMDDALRAGVGPEYLERLIDDLRPTTEARVTALIKETEEGWKVSLRSRGGVDVSAIAAVGGGGGHHAAAGYDAAGTLEAVVGAIRERLA
jgi:nanoRNase/pAp phosphatase (c-di-AMP/oligoRNAs hydrolase)